MKSMGKNFLGFLVAFVMLFCVVNQSYADFIALTFTGGNEFIYISKPFPNTIGWEFKISAPVTVTSLGFYDFGGDGLFGDHEVGIWNTSLQNLLVSAVVGSSDPLDQGFRWISISPYELAVGTYRIGASINVYDENYDNYISNADSLSLTAPVTYSGAVFSSDGYAYPNEIGYTNNGRFGPNFKFTTSSVPEPSTALLLGIGLAGTAFAGRRMRRAQL